MTMDIHDHTLMFRCMSGLLPLTNLPGQMHALPAVNQYRNVNATGGSARWNVVIAHQLNPPISYFAAEARIWQTAHTSNSRGSRGPYEAINQSLPVI